MKLVAAAGGALVSVALILFACTGEDPVLSSDPTVDGATETGGGGTDAPSGDAADASSQPPRLKCAVQNSPLPAQLGSLGFDGGNGAVDAERFSMELLGDKNTVGVAAIVKSPSGGAGAVSFWTIRADQGSPSPQTIATLDVPGTFGTRILWVGRLSDGLGALAFGPEGAGSDVGFRVYKLSDSDIYAAQTTPVTAWSVVSPPVLMKTPIFQNSQGGAVIPLDQNDYFIVGTVSQGSTGNAKLVTARLSSSINALVETTVAPAAVFPGGIIPVGNSIHVFLATGNFGTNLTPFHFSFDRGTAAENNPRITLANDLLVGSTSWSGGTGVFFLDGDLAAGKANGLRIGSVSNIDAIDPTKLALLPVPLSDIAIGTGVDLRMWSTGLPKPIVLEVGGRKTGPGVGILWADVDGNVLANQPASGVDALLLDVKPPSIVAAAAMVMHSAPTATLASFPFVWVVRGGGADTLYYSRIICQ
jgi:hypothetical protein